MKYGDFFQIVLIPENTGRIPLNFEIKSLKIIKPN